jgi:diguanylate cyclase (GGDEF)-like protein
MLCRIGYGRAAEVHGPPFVRAAWIRAYASFNPRRWALWSQRPRLIGYCLLVELAAVTLTVAASNRPAHWHDARIFAALAGMGVIQAELSRHVERVRRRINATPHINMTSVWTFAGVVLLPIQLIPLLVAVLYIHLAIRSWYRLRRVPPFRTVFNASLATLTCLAARGVLAATHFPGIAPAIHQSSSGFSALLAAAAGYFLIGALIALPGLSLQSHSLESLFGTWSENALEMTTIGLGAVSAVLLVAMPELAVAIIPPMLLVQRGVLVKELEIAATTDEKTGVLNATGWRHLAAREFRRAASRPNASLGVLMADLDHFKRINDQYGHLAGDAVLKAVADSITGAVRGYDSVGRFGGEEFVVLLPDASRADTSAVAERIRHTISTLTVLTHHSGQPVLIQGLSVSVGAALYPTAAPTVEGLLHAADAALYRAKALGRNLVTFEPGLPPG